MKQKRSRSWLSMLLIMCMIVTTVGFTGGEKASAAGKSFYHAINKTIYEVDAPINETITVADTADWPKQIAHLLIYANDVDEQDGEWDVVTWNGERQGILSGQNNKDSTTVFPLDISKIAETNNLTIDVTNAPGVNENWRLFAHWAQLVIDNGPVEKADITKLQPKVSAAGTVTVAIDTRAIAAGDYYLEANLIDENGFNHGIYTQEFLGASANQMFENSFDVTGLPPGKYTANAILYNYNNTAALPHEKLGEVQHILSRTIDTRALLSNISFAPVGGAENIVISPAPFNPYTTEYTAAVPYGTSALTPAAVLPDAIPAGTQLAVRVNEGSYGDVIPGEQEDIPLRVGRNTIQYKLYSADNPDGTIYTITVDRAPKLEDLSPNPGTALAPEFDGDTPNPASGYRSTVGNSQENVVLTPVLPAGAAEGTSISVKVNDGEFEALADGAVQTDELPLQVGRNTIIVRVTSPDGLVHTDYPVYIDREPALASPGMSEGDEELEPEFSSDQYEYTTVVGHTSTPITLTPSVNDNEIIEIRINSSDEADFQVVGSGVTSDDLDLLAGTNLIEVRVKSPDYDLNLGDVPANEKEDLIKTYTFTVIRDPFLTDIVVKDQTLREEFDANVLEHRTTATLPYTQSHVNVTPTTTDAPVKLEIRVNGGVYAPINSGDLSANLPIISGANTIEIKATSTNPEDEAEYSTVYTVIVNKEYPPYYAPPAPTSQLTAGKDNNGQNVLVTDIIGKSLGLSAYLVKSDGTKLDRPSFSIDPQGGYTLQNIPAGEYSMVLTVKAPTGQELAGHVAKLEVDKNNVGKADAKLIDPRSKVSDLVTGKALDGVTVTLYWADTELNRSKGRKPGEAVNLPVLSSFASHKNSAAQTTLADGIFGWVLFVDGDYYFVAEKNGYTTFDSRQDTRTGNFGEGSSINNGIIHIGKSLVSYNFSMKPVGVEGGSHDPYMKGYPDGTFKPERGISRAELAAVLSRIFPVDAEAARTVPQLSDLTVRFWASDSIDTALKQGWLKGYTDGTFKANKFVTRAEIAQVIYNMNASEWNQAGGNTSFNDIAGHWGAKAIKAIADQGLIGGDVNGSFRPNDAITRAEAVTLFNQLLGRNPVQVSQSPTWSDVTTSYWAYNDIMEASVAHNYVVNEEGAETWVN